MSTVFGIPLVLRSQEKRIAEKIGIPYLLEGELFEMRAFEPTYIQRFDIIVGPIEATHLPAWMPGGQQRRFLSSGLLPLLLPPAREVDIEILSDKAFVYESTDETPVYWDQNFKLV